MLRTITSVVFSAVLLVIAFPQIHWPILGWVGMVPWLLILEHKNARACFGWSWLVGFLFFCGTLGWFVYVTAVGAFILIAYLGLYFALFGLSYHYFKSFPTTSRIFLLACTWVVLEFARAHLISGFSWASLAHSQFQNIFLIQIADITGFYGVSFLMVAVNVLLALSIQRAPHIHKARLIVMCLLFVSLGYGFYRIKTLPKFTNNVAVGVVQPNIVQDMKWDPKLQPWIVQKTINATVPLSKNNLNLIVWPETSLPGVYTEVPLLVDTIKEAATFIKTPILMGAITDEQGTYFNSAYLISDKGIDAGRYDKMHLVMFGEYIPWRFALGWIGNIVGLEDFTAGKEYTLLSAGPNKTPFGVLICFEDSVGYLWRNFTTRGAQFFVNMTNDAWFKDTKAPFLHMAASVFACVENKRALVRSANTGVSGIIDPLGRIMALVEDSTHKHTFIAGITWGFVPAVSLITFYTKYADIFTYACFVGILWGIFKRSVIRYD